MPKAISLIFMWLTWFAMALLAVLMAHYVSGSSLELNSFSRPFGIYAAGMLLIPGVICSGLRYWLWRTRTPWLVLIPFFIGTFFAWQTGLYGIYLLPQFCLIYQIFSGALFLAYLPLFVRIDEPPPPLPKTKN